MGFAHTPAILVTAVAVVNRDGIYGSSFCRMVDDKIASKGKVAGSSGLGIFSFIWQ